MRRHYGSRLTFFGWAPWIVLLLVFKRFVNRAGVSLLQAAFMSLAFGVVAAYLLFVFVWLPEKCRLPLGARLNPFSWPADQRRVFFRACLGMLVVTGLLVGATLAFGR